MDRYVRLDISVPPILSYSDPEDPQLRVTLTLVNSATSITISRLDTRINPLVNSLAMVEADTGNDVKLPTQDVCYGKLPGTTTQEDMDRLITLQPDMPYEISENFRPFGKETLENSNVEGASRYRFLRFGMHLFKAGKPYRLSAIEGGVYGWMEGDKYDLLGKLWESSWVQMPFRPGEGVEFQIEGDTV